MDLITDAKDERLALGNPETLPSIDDTPQTVDKMHVLRDSLHAALSRAEAAEAQLADAKGRVLKLECQKKATQGVMNSVEDDIRLCAKYLRSRGIDIVDLRRSERDNENSGCL